MTMTVRQMREWLATFEDQDAIVEVVHHSAGGDYYEQGGTVEPQEFNPEQHVKYRDLRGNQFVRVSDPYYNRRSVLFGAINE